MCAVYGGVWAQDKPIECLRNKNIKEEILVCNNEKKSGIRNP